MAKRKYDATNADKPQLLLIIVLAILVTVLVLFAVFFGSSLAPFPRQLVLIILAAFCTMLVRQTTAATAVGRLFWVRFKIIGTGATLVIFYLLFLYCVPNADTRIVRLYLETGNKPLNQKFTINIRQPGMELINKTGEDGEASIELPGHIGEIDDLSVICVGYHLRDTRPFKITNGIIRLSMVRDAEISPLDPSDFPDPSSVPNLPTSREVLDHVPAITDPTRVTLEYKNVFRNKTYDC